MRCARLALLLLLAPVAQATPLLVGVVADLPGSWDGDEAVAIGSDAAVDLSGYRVTDGEGTWTVPVGTNLAAGATTWLVGNLSTWQHFQGAGPAITPVATGPFQLANDGDDLRLLAPDGAALDAFAYGGRTVQGMSGDLPYASSGLVYTRLARDGQWTDTDRAADWITPRLHRVGESVLDRPTFEVSRLTLYASPDSSFDVLSDLIASARERLQLHVYEFRSDELADRLVSAAAANPGLDLQVLVDSNPVGADASDRHQTADVLRRVAAAGGHAWLAGNGRYDDHHLKVLVADDAVAIQSENWVASGVPQDPSWGNRGWGVVVHDAAVADWFAALLAADRAAWDTTPFDLASYDPLFTAPGRLAPRTGDYGPRVPPRGLVGSFRVTPLVSPDHSQDPTADPLAALIAGAGDRVLAQQLDLTLDAKNPLGWSSDDPLAAALAAAADRGVEVRAQAAAPFSADDTGNRDAFAWLAARGVETSVMDRPGIASLHNKGLIVDDTVVVGSMNGNHHSRSANREVDIVVESSEAADYFAALFDADWKGQRAPRDVGTPLEDLKGIPAAGLPFVVLAVALAARQRRG